MTNRKIFVFGSNLAGIHGAGQAYTAKQLYGAVQGIGEGLTGNAYAIPTKTTPYQTRSLEDIKESIDKFINFAKQHNEYEFYIPRIGCGRAGYTDSEIAPMFENISSNCTVCYLWKEYVPSNHKHFHNDT